ncbi:MAG: tetratricopeptide repeat protein [Proteobacteria bacterium]|nr:tetratricopeptide repeat protein [Pseudomonadota bacterium]
MNFSRTLRTELLILLGISLLVLFLYSPALNGPFVLDDDSQIVSNPYIRITGISFENLTKAVLKSPLPKRPVANISFALDYYFHQYRTFGYHLFNVMIHLATGFVLYLLFKITLQRASKSEESDRQFFMPLIAVALWLIHPLQTQSATYIVQRMNSLGALFFITSLLFYIHARLAPQNRRRIILLSLSLISALLAFGSKENTAMLPVFIFLYEWFFFQDADKKFLVSRQGVLAVIALLIFYALAFYMTLGIHPVDAVLAGYGRRDFTLPERMMTQGRVFFYYLSLFVLPMPGRMNLDHDFVLSTSLMIPPTTILALAGIVFLLIYGIFAAQKNRLFSFTIFWLFGNLLIESTVIGLEIIFEHRMYLPSMFLCLLVVVAAHRIISSGKVFYAAAIILGMIFSFWSYQRNTVWADEISLWQDCAKKSPLKARPNLNLGNAYSKKADFEKALVYFRKALEIDPEDYKAHNNIGSTYALDQNYEMALEHFNEAKKIKPDNMTTLANIAMIQENQGHLKEAIYSYKEAIKADPDFTPAYLRLAFIFEKMGNPDRAQFYYQGALEIDQSLEIASNNLGIILGSQGKLDEAIEMFKLSLRANPDFIEAKNNLIKARSMKIKPSGN